MNTTLTPPAGAIPFGASPVQTPPASSLPPGAIPFSAADAPTQSTGSRVLSTVGGIANNIERPFIDVAATPVQLGVALYNKITGKNIQDPYAEGMPGAGTPIGGGTIPVASATSLGGLSQKAADVSNIALMGAGGEATGVRALTALGAAQGLSQGLGEGDEDPSDLVKDTIGGGIFGGVIGAGGNLLRWMGNAEVAKTGVIGQVKNAIASASPDLVQNYINTTLDHADDIRSPTPDALAENAMESRADILVNKVIPAAGKIGRAHV